MKVPRIIVPKRLVDGRGWFNETFHERDRVRLAAQNHSTASLFRKKNFGFVLPK
jgi:dTDP-4-dehydrorhamnose 3,5-epimerase-like enzyme